MQGSGYHCCGFGIRINTTTARSTTSRAASARQAAEGSVLVRSKPLWAMVWPCRSCIFHRETASQGATEEPMKEPMQVVCRTALLSPVAEMLALAEQVCIMIVSLAD